MDTKICLGFLLKKECPDSKNSDVLKTAESGNFETVNYSNLTIFGGFVAILAKKVVIFGTTLDTTFFLRESPQNRQNIVQLLYS